MLAFPTATLAERGARLHYSVSYLNVIINSDMFKAIYTQRRDSFRERLDSSIANKTAEAANAALDIVLETLEKKRGAIPFTALADFTDKTLQRLGYGAPKGAAIAVNVHAPVFAPQVTAEELSAARARIRAAETERLTFHATVVEEKLPSEQATESLPALPQEEVV
jgi:hypothetical protein